jgi:hypothetical protein
LGQSYFLKKVTLTDQDGRYYLTDTLRDNTAVFIGILDSIKNYTSPSSIQERYFLLNPEIDRRDVYYIYKPDFAKSNEQRLIIPWIGFRNLPLKVSGYIFGVG